MFLLEEQEHIVGKGGESGEPAAETGDEKDVHRGRNQMGFLGHAEEKADDEAADDIHGERTPRKGRIADEMGEFARQKTQAGADEAAQTCNQHCFEHIVSRLKNDGITNSVQI